LSERLAKLDREVRAQGFTSESARRRWEEKLEELATIEMIEREHTRAPELELPASDEKFQTLVDAQRGPRDRVDEKKAAAKVPGQLAEAQVSLVPRCALCHQPLTGSDVGKPAHRRCPR
jgi:hypothetical protein